MFYIMTTSFLCFTILQVSVGSVMVSSDSLALHVTGDENLVHVSELYQESRVVFVSELGFGHSINEV